MLLIDEIVVPPFWNIIDGFCPPALMVFALRVILPALNSIKSSASFSTRIVSFALSELPPALFSKNIAAPSDGKLFPDLNSIPQLPVLSDAEDVSIILAFVNDPHVDLPVATPAPTVNPANVGVFPDPTFWLIVKAVILDAVPDVF